MKTRFTFFPRARLRPAIFGLLVCFATTGWARDKKTIPSAIPFEGDVIVRREGNVLIWERRADRASDIIVEPSQPGKKSNQNRAVIPRAEVVRGSAVVTQPTESPIEREKDRTLGGRLRSIFGEENRRQTRQQPTAVVQIPSSAVVQIPSSVTLESSGPRFATRSLPQRSTSTSSRRSTPREVAPETFPPTPDVASETKQTDRSDPQLDNLLPSREPSVPGRAITSRTDEEIDAEWKATSALDSATTVEKRNASGDVGKQSLAKRGQVGETAPPSRVDQDPISADSKPLAPLPENKLADKTPSNPPKKAGPKNSAERPIAIPTGNTGIVKSPYPPHHSLDVRGLASGSLAKDPSTGEIFRLP